MTPRKLWHQQYQKLVEFKRKNGHCMVTQRSKEDKSLAKWVHTQRACHQNNKLRLDRKGILDKIGFAWKDDAVGKPNDKLWHQQHQKLVEFRQEHGHCRVPQSYEQDKSLGSWVMNQRSYYNNDKLRLDRKKILEGIGFVWKGDAVHNFNRNYQLWHQHYEKLVEFKRMNGHCDVPWRYERDKSLAGWIKKQRNLQRNDKIQLGRKTLLDEVGVAWKDKGTHNPLNRNPLNHTHDDKRCFQGHAQLETTEPAQGHRKRPSAYLTESGQIGAGRSQKYEAEAASIYVPVDEDCARDEKDSKPSAVTPSSVPLIFSSREAVREEATRGEIPSCWKVCFPI
jgi:hypothetical protein